MTIYNVPSDRRYWVVRADGGKYYQHFTHFDVIALGHLDEMQLQNTEEGYFFPESSTLIEAFDNLPVTAETTSRQKSAHYSQAKSFIYEMDVGDWVLTIGPYLARFGRIISPPYLNKESLKITVDRDKDRTFDCNFQLRRNVAWGPSISRANLPYGLLRSLRANQTLFNIDDHWEAIYHTLYAAFLAGNTLYLSARINSSENISNYDVTQVFSLLTEVEILGKELLNNNLTPENFDEVVDRYAAENKITITTKAQFHSPGDIWNAIVAIGDATHLDAALNHWATSTFAIYSLIFGNKKLGVDGVVDLKTRQKLWELIIARMKKHNADTVVKKLEIDSPSADTSPLENENQDTGKSIGKAKKAPRVPKSTKSTQPAKKASKPNGDDQP
jgi:predicted Mrr-cat superfamily restriction endonuclease